MKTRFIWILIASGMACMAACNNPTTQEALSEEFTNVGVDFYDPRLDAPLPKDTLVVGILNTSTSMVIHQGVPLGVEYDLLSLFSEQTRTPIKFVLENNKFHLVEGLRKGKIHLAAGFYHRNIDSAVANLHFTPPLFHNRIVLAAHEGAPVVKNVQDLSGKTIWAPPHSRAAQLLRRIAASQDISFELNLLPDSLHDDEVLYHLGNGFYEYVATDEALVRFFESHFGDVREDVVLSQQDEPIAWLYQDTIPSRFNETVHAWVETNWRSLAFRTVVTNYTAPQSKFQRLGKKIMSDILHREGIPFRPEIEEAASSISWPWELVAAQILRESHFNPSLKSPARAIGLMQITPIAAKEVGFPYSRLYEPELNIKAGTTLLKKLEAYWSDRIADSTERLKFVFASYNAGMGHIEDARRLAKKHGKNPDVWDGHVEAMTLALSKPVYHRDPVVKYGYCRGREPVQYVSEILRYYALYTEGTLLGRNAINSPPQWPWQFRPGQG